MQAFQVQWEVIVSYLYQLAIAMEYPWPTWEVEPEIKIMMSKVQKYPKKTCSAKTELVNFSNEESCEITSEGGDVNKCACPPTLMLPSAKHEPKTKRSVKSHYCHEGIVIKNYTVHASVIRTTSC